MEKSREVRKTEGRQKNLRALFTLMRKVESLSVADRKTSFSSTEIRLLGEILNASYTGKRMISTQLAKTLGVTRSAISQIVNRLEREGIVKRVADDVDRKIAYIELTEKTLQSYKEDLKVCVAFVDKIVKKFGEERFETMCALTDEFCELVAMEKRAAKGK